MAILISAASFCTQYGVSSLDTETIIRIYDGFRSEEEWYDVLKDEFKMNKVPYVEKVEKVVTKKSNPLNTTDK